MMIISEPIGYVHNACTESQAPELIKQETSRIEILPAFSDGLEGIEQCEYLDLVFSFHQEKRTELTGRIRTGETKGIFASRSPRRPNHIGITTVKLLQREGNTLHVAGADALDGSPVIDIKYCDTSLFDQADIHRSVRIDSPRIDITRNIMSNDTRELLLKAAQLHGHVCPGLALGVLGATRMMQQLYSEQQDINDCVLTVEMQNCPADGLMFVTGCTPGTRRFVMNGKNTMTAYLTAPDGKGWKLQLRESNREYMGRHLPDSLTPAEKGLATLQLDFNELFSLEKIE